MNDPFARLPVVPNFAVTSTDVTDGEPLPPAQMSGIFQIPGVPSFSRDPHKIHWGRLGIDATKPIAHAADFERKTTPGLRELRLDDYLSPNA